MLWVPMSPEMLNRIKLSLTDLTYILTTGLSDTTLPQIIIVVPFQGGLCLKDFSTVLTNPSPLRPLRRLKRVAPHNR